MNVALHWNSFRLLWATLVIFVWLFFPCLFPSLTLLFYLGFLTSSFVLRDSVDFSRMPVSSWLEACLPMVYLPFHTIQRAKGSPWARRIPTSAATPTPGPGAHLIRCAKVSGTQKYRRTRIHTLKPPSVDAPVSHCRKPSYDALWGRRKELLLPGLEWFDLSYIITHKCYCLMKCLDTTDRQSPLAR